MKTLWNIVSFLAVVHLLALAMFVAWMWKTERLDGERVGELREMLAMTIPEAEAAAAQQAKEVAQQQQQMADVDRRRNPGIPSGERVRSLTDAQQSEQRSVRRISDVKAELARQIALTEAKIDEQRNALEAERESFEGGVAGDRERKSAEQLAKSVKLLSSLPPKQAKREIIELVNTGKKDEAVMYLDAMNTRIAAKILTEFKTDPEVKLATELLELVRTLGQPAGETSARTDPSDAHGSADTR